MQRSLPARIQARLVHFYGIEEAPAVDDFIELSDGDREALLLRERGDHLEMMLRLPRAPLAGERRPSFDELCQIVEGVSHFLYMVERARRELPTTQLELELQAEVDKYLLLALGTALIEGLGRFEPRRSARIRARLFERVSFLHPEGTELGDRYRMANALAARFSRLIEARFSRYGNVEKLRATLWRFYQAGQTEKLELAQAA